MSAWDLFTDDGSTYSWRRADDVCLSEERILGSPISCVSSMVDLFREERLNMAENDKLSRQILNEKETMFRTGSGKRVLLNKSSVEKAIFVLGEGNEEETNSARRKVDVKENFSFSSSSSLYQSGSGKSRNVSSATLDSAKNLLEIDLSDSDAYNQPFRTPNMQFDQNSEERNGHTLPILGPKGYCSEANSMDGDKAIFMQSYDEIKFQTAGGKSLSVSRDALKRARSLLVDPELDGFLNDECSSSPFKLVADGGVSSGSKSLSLYTNPASLKTKFLKKSLFSPLMPNHASGDTCSKPDKTIFGENLLNRFNEVDENSISNGNVLRNAPVNVAKLSVNKGRALADISNSHNRKNQTLSINEVKRSVRKSFGRSFKRPRSSKFIAPLSQTCSQIPNGVSVNASSFPRRIVSCRFPIKVPRIYIKEYITSQAYKCKLYVNAHPFEKECNGTVNLETEFLQNMLTNSGALLKYASREWVANHCHWITWKLASYDKNNHFIFPTKLLTSSNVWEELKYRYEREFGHGHRSAVKRILEGDAPASSLLILCISGVHCSDELNAKLELTDGWYPVFAALDAPLSRHLAMGKLFVGQKLRIWGASLHGWDGPISPLEASGSVTFALHTNGTYRAHWGDRLGFCKDGGHPLAFRCIKCDGGPVPLTLVGVSRIYPLLYKEKLSNGGSIVRSERLEAKVIESHNQRRISFVEGITTEFEKEYDESKSFIDNDSEGARIYNSLERAAEPDILMADMSPEQLSSFASYQSKVEALKHMDLDKAIEKALKHSDLREREVTTFMKVKVCGLTKSQNKPIPNEGIITIWHPTQKLINDLAEGEAYRVEGLVPVSSRSGALILQASGSTTKWWPLTHRALKNYEPFFVPRSTSSVAKMGEVRSGSEFDTIGYVVHVGDSRWMNRQQEQWVFLADESCSILAVRFWWHCLDDDPFAAINFSGSVVGMCNLVSRGKDKVNQFWIADASENSTFYLNFGSSKCAHLQKGSVSVEKWAKEFPAVIEHLKNQVKAAIGDGC